MLLSAEERNALLLSTLAGLSTVLGGGLAVIKRPGPALLAFLLGVAIGVMALLSVVELWIRNAVDNGPVWVTLSLGLGAGLYYVAHPYFPDFSPHAHSEPQDAKELSKLHLEERVADSPTAASAKSGSARQSTSSRRPVHKSLAQLQAHGHKDETDSQGSQEGTSVAGSDLSKTGSDPASSSASDASSSAARSADLLRLGFLMALTMTLHNAPEGFAVAFASFTNLGGIMALAIAVHNIPEGVIVAAPVFAATGSRCKACGLALASGLSEPVGALLALLVVKPFLTPRLVHLMLAFVGGIMLAVCCTELWTEGRKCLHDRQLALGICLGAVIMGITLLLGV